MTGLSVTSQQPSGNEKIFKEPITPFGPTGKKYFLSELHDHCLDVAGWITPEAEQWARGISRVGVLLATRPQDYGLRLPRLAGLLLQRPVLAKGDRVIIGRPKDRVAPFLAS